MSWKWVSLETVLAIHDRQIEEHGGSSGLRDLDLLQSALARPQYKSCYAPHDAFDLAAAYAFGLIMDHPFVDGNKRTAYVTTRVFLHLNAVNVSIPRMEVALTIVSLAAGEIGEEELAARLREWRL